MSKKQIHEVDLDKFGERLSSESDRACAVLGAALLDAKLEGLLRRRLLCFHDELLESTRPLGTFSARIRLARALGWISDDVRVDLDIVRGVRNDFAHSFDHDLSFDDRSVKDRCTSLRTAQAFIDGFDIAATAPNRNLSSEALRAMQAVFKPARWRFQLAVDFVAQYLDGIPSESTEYSGPNLLEDLRALSARTRVQASMTITVDPPPSPLPNQPNENSSGQPASKEQ